MVVFPGDLGVFLGDLCVKIQLKSEQHRLNAEAEQSDA